MNIKTSRTALFIVVILVFPTSILAQSKQDLSQHLTDVLSAHPLGLSGFKLPNSADLDQIPQDHTNNPITSEKINLGRFLFHETGVGTETASRDRQQTYSCATCHHAAAGFKAGIPQGLGDGGVGFGHKGFLRRLGRGLDPTAEDGDAKKPDFQPIASPTVLNSAYQDVMLWNGSFGNSNGGINYSVPDVDAAGPEGIGANRFSLPGLETQVLAGTKVHRLRFDAGSVLQSNRQYRRLYSLAYPDGDTGYIPNGSSVTPEALGAAKAIAAYERIVLAHEAPFQKWLRGDQNAMTTHQMRGALLFFGKANCVSCHTGPALSSLPGVPADQLFFNVGFEDFNVSHGLIHGTVPEDVSRGRGGFTKNPLDYYKFKIPTLYNLRDTYVLGHGASFRRVHQVVRYKNRARPQSSNIENLAPEFVPLNLTSNEVADLARFVRDALYDPDLMRYQPSALPTGNCYPAADFRSALELRCW